MRTPKPYYFKNGVIVFFVKDKIIYYKIIKWSEDGMIQWSDKLGKYDGSMENLIGII